MENHMQHSKIQTIHTPLARIRKAEMEMKRVQMFHTYDKALFNRNTIQHSFSNACRFADIFRCAIAKLMRTSAQGEIAPHDMPDGLWGHLKEHGKYQLNFDTLERRHNWHDKQLGFEIAITTRAEANLRLKTPEIGDCIVFILNQYENVHARVLGERDLSFGRVEVKILIHYTDPQKDARYSLDTVTQEDVEQYAAAASTPVELKPSEVRRIEPSEAPMTREVFESITISDMVTKRVHKRTAFLQEERLKIQGTVEELQKVLKILDDKIANVAIDEMKALMEFLER